MDFSWTTWLVSVAAVLISGLLAWLQGNLATRPVDPAQGRPALDMGFANHGGMWGDLLLLPIANAVIVPSLRPGPWIAVALAVCAALSAWVHIHWYRGDRIVHGSRCPVHSAEHMWPSRPHGSWWRDLSWAGWAHVVYVSGELTVLMGVLLFPMAREAIAWVCVILSVHVPLGLLQPRWFLTGDIAGPRKQPLLIPCLAVVWIVAFLKL